MRSSATVLLILALFVSIPAIGGEKKSPTDLFEGSYEHGALAAKARNWPEAELYFSTALKALGDYDHPKKEVAEILLKKAKDIISTERQLDIAEEFVRLRQWKEAEEAYGRAAKWIGMTVEIQNAINAAKKAARDEIGLPQIVVEREKADTQAQALSWKANQALLDGDLKAATLYCDQLERINKLYASDAASTVELRKKLFHAEMEKKRAPPEQKAGDDF